MKRSLFGWVLLTFIMLTNFTNCDVYSNNAAFLAHSTACGTLCSDSANPDMLEIKINIPDTPSNYAYSGVTTQFDLGGDCNEGGYPTSIINWHITNTRTQAVVRDSISAGGAGSCKWGRFQLAIDTGVALNEQHTLTVEIIGLDDFGQTANNTIIGRNTIYLNPQ